MRSHWFVQSTVVVPRPMWRSSWLIRPGRDIRHHHL